MCSVGNCADNATSVMLEKDERGSSIQSMYKIFFLILIVTTIKPIYKQLNAFRANWLALTW